MFCALQALVDPGDEVIVFEPAFPWYFPWIQLAGGVPRTVALRPPTFSLLDSAKEFRAALSPRTKAVIVNSPHK